MEKKPKILVVGSMSMDLICTTKRVPNEGETVIGESFAMAPGGKGANQAVQMARLGADVTMVGCVGNDAFGDELIQSLSQAGVNTQYIIKKDGISTGCAQITLDISSGKAANRIMVLPQANRAIGESDISFIREMIQDYDMVVLQNEINMEINVYLARIAGHKGVRVLYNPAPAESIPQEIVKYVSYLCPNEHEAYELTGVKITQSADGVRLEEARTCADALIKVGFQDVLITLGSQGSFFADGKQTYHIPCAKVDKVADTTAAGDSFIGAFCTELCKGSSVDKAMYFASYTAALTVSKMGAQPSLPTIEEVKTYIKESESKE